MIELAVASGKGGVGKSTLSATLALYLHRKGWSIVAADADAEAPNLHLVLGNTEWSNEKEYEEGFVAEILRDKCTDCGLCADACSYNAIELVDGHYRVNQVVCEGCVTCILVCPEKAIRRRRSTRGKLRWTTTSYGFPLVGARLYAGRPNSGKIVTEVKNIARSLASDSSVIILDSAAGIGCQVISSLAGAHAAILVAEPTPASLSDLKRIHALTRHFMMPAMLVINKYDVNPEYSERLAEYAGENNIHLLGKIPYDDAVPRSMAEAQPLIEAYPDSPASKALLEIAGKIENILRNWASWFVKHRPRKPEPYKPSNN